MLKYKNFSLIKPEEEQRKRISHLINEYNGSIFHEVELNKIVQDNFGSELFYLVDNPKNINSFTPIHITKNKLGVKRYNCNPLGDIPYAGFVGKEQVDVKQFEVGFFESVKYVGFPYIKDTIHKSNNNLGSGETNMVDLSLEEDEIFSKMSSSKRRNIRKAIKAEIEVKHFFTEEGLEQFWPILEQLHKSLGYHEFTLDYYKNFIQNYGSQKQAFVLIAYKEKVPVSGLFILGNKNYMHFYKGASLFDVKKVGQGELLHWEAIKLSKSLGAKYYDLCNLNKEKLPEIYRFKTGISQNIIEYTKYTKNSIGYKVANRI